MLSIVFKLLCLVGFVYQILHISLEYFAFKTTTKISLQLENNFINPSVIFCTRYTDIIDKKNYKSYGIHAKDNRNLPEIRSIMSELTIKDVFDLTPNPNSIMTGCQFREFGHDLTTYNSSACYKKFYVTKYQEGAFICYQFRTKIPDSKFDCHKTALSYLSTNELYLIRLSPIFLKSDAIKVISFVPGNSSNSILNIPFASRRFYHFTNRYVAGDTNDSTISYILVAGDMYLIKRLENPYDTRCTNIEKDANHVCRRKCNIDAYRSYNLYPYNEFATKPIPLKNLDIHHLNVSLIRDVENKINSCSKRCWQEYCYDWFTVTVMRHYPQKGEMSFVSRCSDRPKVAIEFLAKLSLMEFILYCSSSLGLWFGISLVSVNPFEKYRQARKARNTNSVCHCLEIHGVSLQSTAENFSRRIRQLEKVLIH